jgi:hypothetical protein
MPVPEGVKDIRPGDIIERNVCDRQRLIRDRQLEKSFAHRRRPDRERAWIEVRIAFGRDFPKGVSFALELRDEKGRRVDPRCHLAVQQPRVFSGEAVEYRIDFAGRSAVANFARTRALSYRELVAHGGGVREPRMKQLCEDGS